jgi:hypothetical protein
MNKFVIAAVALLVAGCSVQEDVVTSSTEDEVKGIVNPSLDQALTEVTPVGLAALTYSSVLACQDGSQSDCHLKETYFQIARTYKDQGFRFTEEQANLIEEYDLRMIPTQQELARFVKDYSRDVEGISQTSQ